jgi:serine/threonine-protein kinase BUR1
MKRGAHESEVETLQLTMAGASVLASMSLPAASERSGGQRRACRKRQFRALPSTTTTPAPCQQAAMASTTPAKRPAPDDAGDDDPRAPKRTEASEPEEGEVADEDGPPPADSPAPAPASSKVAFPFKKKSTDEGALAGGGGAGGSKDAKAGPGVIYTRPHDHLASAPPLSNPRRGGGGGRGRSYGGPRGGGGGGDSYRPPSPSRRGDPRGYRPDWDRPGGGYGRAYPPLPPPPPPYDDRHYVPDGRRWPQDPYAQYGHPPRPRSRERTRPPVDDYSPPAARPASSRSPSGSRSRAGSPSSPSSVRKEKHRLPPPRSPPAAFSPMQQPRVDTYRPAYARDPYERDFGARYDRFDHRGRGGGGGGDYFRGDYYDAPDWDRAGRSFQNPRDEFRLDRYHHSTGPGPGGGDFYRPPPRSQADTYRPMSPPAAPRPPSPTTTAPAPSARVLSPLPLERRKDETLPAGRTTVTIAVRDHPDLPMREDTQTALAPGGPPTPAPPPPAQRTREEEKAAYGRVFTGCGLRADYELATKLGEGTFGEVHKATHRASGRPVALKRILMHNEKEGMPVTALREIKMLKAMRHPCVIELLDMFVVRSE